MNRTTISGAVVLGLLAGAFATGGAHAADIPSAAPSKAVRIAAPSWTGAYVGLSLGARWADADWTTNSFTTAAGLVVPPSAVTGTGGVNTGTYDSIAFRIGGYFGYNWQIAPLWVTGLEADFGWADNKKTNQRIPGSFVPTAPLVMAVTANDVSNVDASWDASIRARLGYLISPTIMIFGTGGVAFQRVTIGATCNGGAPPNFMFCIGTFTDRTSKIATGWTIGGGVEGIVWGNWLARAEYRYADFGNVNFSLFTPSVAPFILSLQGDVKVRTHLAALGLAYRFAP